MNKISIDIVNSRVNIHTSERRALAILALVAIISAFGILPVHADLYVVSSTGNRVSRFDSSGSALATPTPDPLIGSGLSSPHDALVDSAGNLYVSNTSANTVGKYDAKTGAVINASFITGLSGPRGLAMDATGNIYVVNTGSNSIGKYDGKTGLAINASLITGLNAPRGIDIAVGNIYVANYGANSVGKYTLEGVAVTQGTPPMTTDFITGLSAPYGVKVDAAGNLYVSNYSANTIGKYSALTGAAISSSYISTGAGTSPCEIVVDGKNLYVVNFTTNTVAKYDISTSTPTTINTSYVTSTNGLSGPIGIAFTPYSTTTTISIGTTWKVRYPVGATQDLIDAATMICTKLHDITGGTFTPQVYNGTWTTNSIILGKGTDLNIAELPDVTASSTYDAKGREHYIIGNASGPYIVIAGTTDWAVSRGAYDFLQQVGCRWFFPGSNWTYTPTGSSATWTGSTRIRTNPSQNLAAGLNGVTVVVNSDETPAYKWRLYAMGFVDATYDLKPNWDAYIAWAKTAAIATGLPVVSGAMPQGLTINVAEHYGEIAAWGQTHEPTLWNDDFWSLIGGTRTPGTQLGVSNHCDERGLHNIVKDYVKDSFAQYPQIDAVSLNPLDGPVSKWCQCVFCQEIQNLSTGYVTNRVVYLANAGATQLTVANNLDKKYIAYTAYESFHAAPGTGIDPETGLTTTFTPTPADKTYVALSTGFVGTDGTPVLNRMPQWRAAAPNVNLGIYDFFYEFLSIGGYSEPGWMSATDLSYIASRPGIYGDNHADIYIGETSNGWGPAGLGYYLMSKKLWRPSADIDALKGDFLAKSFGAAVTPMTDFYSRIDSSNKYVTGLYSVNSDLLGRLHQDIKQARTLTSDTKVINRLNDLTVWLVYCELFKDYWYTPAGPARLAALKKAMRFAYRIRSTNMVDCSGLFQSVTNYEAGFTWPTLNDSGNPPPSPATTWNDKVDKGTSPNDHPYKPADTFSSADIVAMNNGTYSYAINSVDNPTSSPVILTKGSTLDTMPESPKNFSEDVIPSCRTASTRGGIFNIQYSTPMYMYSTTGSLPAILARAASSGTGMLYRTSDTLKLNPLETQTVTSGWGWQTVTFGSYTKGAYVWRYDGIVSTMDAPAHAYFSYAATFMYPLIMNGSGKYYFYVPKGTRYVEMHAGSIGSNLTGVSFYNASNPTQAKTFSEQPMGTTPVYNLPQTGGIPGDGSYTTDTEITIPVGDVDPVTHLPTGTNLDDDQIWCMSAPVMNVTNIYFWNIPGLIARNSDELVIPREAYSNLKPAGQSASATTGTVSGTRGKIHLYLYTDAGGNLPTLTISSGWSSLNYGSAKWSLFREKDDTILMDPNNPTMPLAGTIATDQANYTVTLPAVAGPGCYHFILDDTYNGLANSSIVTWPSGSMVLQACNPQEPLMNYTYTNVRYFFVPKGTKTVDMKASAINICNFYNAAGTLKRAQATDNNNPKISIPVGNDDGQVWSVTGFKAQNVAFLTPGIPGFSLNADQLLVPQWVYWQIQGAW